MPRKFTYINWLLAPIQDNLGSGSQLAVFFNLKITNYNLKKYKELVPVERTAVNKAEAKTSDIIT